MGFPASNEQSVTRQGSRIESVSIAGFRSLADFRIPRFPDVTVLIGPNGSGKSNLIRFFEMLSWMLKSRNLELFVAKHGGGGDQLFGGSEMTSRMQAEIRMRTSAGDNDYRFALSYAVPDSLIFTEEAFRFHRKGTTKRAPWQQLPVGGKEAKLIDAAHSDQFPGLNQTTARTIVHLLRDVSHFQFHNTSDTSPMKKKWDVHDNGSLRSHAGNLPAVLHRMQEADVPRYELICHQISRILPSFRGFAINEEYGRVLLRWISADTNQEIGAHLTSDGSLRLFALVTLLNLPSEVLPSVIFLDEPELGLHPAAVELISDMIRSLGVERQIVLATQSPEVVNLFDLREVVVLNSLEGQTVAKTLDPSDERYATWLRSGLTTGELWLKNILGGRP